MAAMKPLAVRMCRRPCYRGLLKVPTACCCKHHIKKGSWCGDCEAEILEQIDRFFDTWDGFPC